MLLVVKEPACQGKRHKRRGFDPWKDWKDPLEGRKADPLQYSCLENPQGQRSLAGYSPQGCKESDTTEVTKHAYTAMITDS